MWHNAINTSEQKHQMIHLKTHVGQLPLNCTYWVSDVVEAVAAGLLTVCLTQQLWGP